MDMGERPQLNKHVGDVVTVTASGFCLMEEEACVTTKSGSLFAGSPFQLTLCRCNDSMKLDKATASGIGSNQGCNDE